MRCLLAAMLIAAVCAVPAQARIVVGKGIGPARIGMSESQVRSELGRPDARAVKRDEIQGKIVRVRYGKLRATLGPAGPGARVQLVSTTSAAQRTAQGVGVGSSIGRVRRSVRGVRCQSAGSGRQTCFVGRFRPGAIITDFRIGRAGRVTEVTVARVID